MSYALAAAGRLAVATLLPAVGGLPRFRLGQPERDQARGRYRRNPLSATLRALLSSYSG
jgi:hypothetical protein